MMKRGTFLKSLVTLIAAPTLMGDKEIKPYVEGKESSFDTDTLHFYTDDISQFRLMDIIISDMGDKAMVTTLVGTAGRMYVVAKPVIKGQYRYKNISEVRLFAKTLTEK